MEYPNNIAEKNYNIYLSQFFTETLNGVIQSKATKIFTPEEMAKVEEMEKELETLKQRWFKVARGQELLED